MPDAAVGSAVPRPRRRKAAIAGWTLCAAAVPALAGYTEPAWNWPHHILPSTIGIDEVLASGSRAGFQAGCEAAVYAMSDATVSQLKTHGIAYLDRSPRPQNDKRQNPYQKWRGTPAEVDFTQSGHGPKPAATALYSSGGCGEEFDPTFRSDEVEKALSAPGSYYALTAKRDGIIVVIPARKLAAFYFYG